MTVTYCEGRLPHTCGQQRSLFYTFTEPPQKRRLSISTCHQGSDVNQMSLFVTKLRRLIWFLSLQYRSVILGRIHHYLSRHYVFDTTFLKVFSDFRTSPQLAIPWLTPMKNQMISSILSASHVKDRLRTPSQLPVFRNSLSFSKIYHRHLST
jgi:hypothetical protein